ncbi:hypothetical protein DFH07DRAFT_788838 [Mycena maculata]|uniref:Uncharacterized protein n=1 Tax=Mycena maculata TaxID=230809 RepID=A0AAD7KE32_9AGAR|nr:hypothetical protein DFH07DRAFT_788838 [Mycena maculata]
MHQAGWTRLPLFKLTRPQFLRTQFLSARDNSSFHARTTPRITKHRGRNAKIASRRPLDSPDPAPNDLRVDDGTSPLPSPKNNAPISFPMERATSRASLFKNLLRLLASRRTVSASLPVLLDYHELHPVFRSVRSYNLLISLAIRHVAYGTVQSLLNGMNDDSIPGNLETQKLKIRWFVRSGLWEHAWLQTTATQPTPIPLPLWLEFFHGVKAGALADRPNSTARSISPEICFQILMQNLPTFVPNELKPSVRAVGIVVRAMLSLNRPRSALTLAIRYFNGLPRHIIGVRWAEQCIAIIDALVAFEAQRRGLLEFHATRRKLNSLLAIHPSLRPTSKTLYLLLATLRRAKECGTLSWQTVQKFKARWGPQVEDRRVRRRVASYAITQRQLDIFDKVFDAERRSRTLRHASGTTVQPQLWQKRRPPFRETYPRHGYEEARWKALEYRALKVRLQLRAPTKKRAGLELPDASST